MNGRSLDVQQINLLLQNMREMMHELGVNNKWQLPEADQAQLKYRLLVQHVKNKISNLLEHGIKKYIINNIIFAMHSMTDFSPLGTLIYQFLLNSMQGIKDKQQLEYIYTLCLINAVTNNNFNAVTILLHNYPVSLIAMQSLNYYNGNEVEFFVIPIIRMFDFNNVNSNTVNYDLQEQNLQLMLQYIDVTKEKFTVTTTRKIFISLLRDESDVALRYLLKLDDFRGNLTLRTADLMIIAIYYGVMPDRYKYAHST